jgi:hypothetical protein
MMKALELNINNMNDFELKGLLLSFIGSAKRQQLVPIFELLKTDLEEWEGENWQNQPYGLSAAQETELMQSLAESYHEENMMTIQEAKLTHARWLKQ